jgi:hypothetical protein
MQIPIAICHVDPEPAVEQDRTSALFLHQSEEAAESATR